MNADPIFSCTVDGALINMVENPVAFLFSEATAMMDEASVQCPEGKHLLLTISVVDEMHE